MHVERRSLRISTEALTRVSHRAIAERYTEHKTAALRRFATNADERKVDLRCLANELVLFTGHRDGVSAAVARRARGVLPSALNEFADKRYIFRDEKLNFVNEKSAGKCP